MSTYLASNPQVYFCLPKEPFYWSTDFPRLQNYFGITSLEKYLKLFEGVEPHHRAVGEKSTSYLASKTAIEGIRSFNENAKILVMLRNPVQMVQSWHGEMLLHHDETIRDFEAAWNIQARRAEGLDVPATCLVPDFLQYRQFACFPAHLERVLRTVPADQVKVVIFEEFIASPREVYLDICSFLGVGDDGRTEFPAVRESHTHVFPALARLVMRPPRWFESIARRIRRRAKEKPTGLLARAKSLMSRKHQRQSLRPEFAVHLREAFAPDVERLEEMIGRPLPSWRN